MDKRSSRSERAGDGTKLKQLVVAVMAQAVNVVYVDIIHVKLK